MLDDLFSITPQGTDSFTTITTLEATPLIDVGDAVDPEGNELPTEKLTNAYTTVTMSQEWTSPDEWIVTQSITKYFDSEENSEADDGTADTIGRDGSTTLTVTVINGTHTIVSYSIEDSVSYSSSLEWDNEAEEEGENSEEEGEEDNGSFSAGFETSSSMTITLEESIIILPDGRTARMYSLAYGTSQSYSSTISAASSFKQSEGELKIFEKPEQEEEETTEPATEELTTGDGAIVLAEPDEEVAADPELEIEHGGNGSAIDFGASYNHNSSFSSNLGLNLQAIVPDGELLDDATVTGSGSFGLVTGTSTSHSGSIDIQLQTSAGDTSTNDASHEYISFASSSSTGNSGSFTFDIEFDIDSSEDETETPETNNTAAIADAVEPDTPTGEPDSEPTEEPNFEFSYSTSNADGGSSVVLYSNESTVENQYGKTIVSDKLTLSGTFSMAASFGFSIAEGITVAVTSSGSGKTNYVSIMRSEVPQPDFSIPVTGGLEYPGYETQSRFSTDSSFSAEVTIGLGIGGVTFSADYSVSSKLTAEEVLIYETVTWDTNESGTLTYLATAVQTNSDAVISTFSGDLTNGFDSELKTKSETIDETVIHIPYTTPPVIAEPEPAGWTTESILDGVQLGLDIAGLVPGLGEPLDLINAGISLGRGNYADAALSIAAMAPVGGQAATGAKLTGKAIAKNLDKADEALVGLRQTGARILDSADPSSWDEAEEIYSALRRTTDDIDEIATNSNMQKNVVERVKNHLFHNEHLLDDGVRRFDADPEIANAWQRLREGIGTDADYQLFKHEHAESIYEQLFGGTYRRAHEAVSTRWPSGL